MLRSGLLAEFWGVLTDMVVVRGVNVYPSAVDAIMRSVPGVAEYRVTLLESKGMTEMEVEVEARRGRD